MKIHHQGLLSLTMVYTLCTVTQCATNDETLHFQTDKSQDRSKTIDNLPTENDDLDANNIKELHQTKQLDGKAAETSDNIDADGGDNKGKDSDWKQSGEPSFRDHDPIYDQTDPDHTANEVKDNNMTICTGHGDEFKVDCSDWRNWNNMSTCEVEETGVNISISYCPRLLRNNTICPKMHVRLNWFDLSKEAQNRKLISGDAGLRGYIPGFDPPIYDNIFRDRTCENERKKLNDSMHIKIPSFVCPLSLKMLQGLAGGKLPHIFENVSNPFPYILPAGTYHVQGNITSEVKPSQMQPYVCLDGWFDFGISFLRGVNSNYDFWGFDVWCFIRV